MVVEPLTDRFVLVWIKVHLDRLQRLHIEDVVGVVQRGFLVVERWKTHSLEVTSVTLLTTHHYPHRPALTITNAITTATPSPWQQHYHAVLIVVNLMWLLQQHTTDVTIIEIEIVFLTENRIKSKSYFSCIPSNDLSIEALDRL